MTLAILSAVFRALLFSVVTYKLIFWQQMLNRLEAFGLGLIGGSSFLTIPVILDVHKEGTPFDGWAGILLSAGMSSYLIGRLTRHIRHQRRNREAVEQSRARLEARGKL